MFWTYYVICVIYCFYKLLKKYNDNYSDGMIGLSPGLDALMVVMLAPALAPIDFGMTWIGWYKKAEEAKKKQSNTFLDSDTFRNEEVHIY